MAGPKVLTYIAAGLAAALGAVLFVLGDKVNAMAVIAIATGLIGAAHSGPTVPAK